jgi:hypothetical protein
VLAAPDAGTAADGPGVKKHTTGDDEDKIVDDAPTASGAGAEEKEPNDDRGKANALEGGKKILGKIFKADDSADVDWYRLEVPASEKSQKLKVELGALAGADLTFEIYKGPNKVLTVDKNKEDGIGEMVSGFGVKPGPYFIKVEAKPRDGAVFSEKGKRYALETEVKEVKEGEEIEPNDGVATSMLVKCGADVTGSFAVPGDSDYYQLGSDGMEAGTVLSITVTAVNDVGMSVTVLDGIKDKVKSASAGVGEKLSMKNLGVKPENAPYYIALKAASGSNPEMDYTLTCTLTKLEGDAELEPNDDPVHATVLEGGKSVTAFFSKGDKDVLKISVPEKAIAHVRVAGIPEVNLKVRLINDKGEKVSPTINENGPGEGEELTNWTIPPGDTYIEVTGAGGNDDVPYTVGLGLLPDDGTLELEPNDDPGTATPLFFDTGDGTHSRKGYLHPKKDRDFYVLDLGSGSEVKVFVKLTGIAKVNLDLTITDESGTVITELKKAKEGYPEEGELTLSLHTRYFFIVKASSAAVSNPRDEYILSVVKR